MWIFVLKGQMEFEATDGERHETVPGSALLLEDTTGKGHLSRVVGNESVVLSVVYL
jgi:quercetin dioxygenase-like cupin family protein